MSDQVDRCFDIGKAVVRDRYGSFRTEPQEWKVVDGLFEKGTNGYTDSKITTERRGNVLLIDSEARPQEIGISKRLVDERPGAACKTLGHELMEWRSAEQMPSSDVIASNTDYVAEFTEDSVCREINRRAGEEICAVDWASENNA